MAACRSEETKSFLTLVASAADHVDASVGRVAISSRLASQLRRIVYPEEFQQSAKIVPMAGREQVRKLLSAPSGTPIAVPFGLC